MAYKPTEISALTPDQALGEKLELEHAGREMLESVTEIHKTFTEKKTDIVVQNRGYLREAMEKSGGKEAVTAALSDIRGYSELADLLNGTDDDLRDNRLLMLVSRFERGVTEDIKQKLPALSEAMNEVANKFKSINTAGFTSPDATAAPGTIAHMLGNLIEQSKVTKEEGDSFAAGVALKKGDQNIADEAFGKGELQRQLSMIYRLAGGRITTLKSIKMSTTAGTRAHANVGTGSIVLSAFNGLDVLWHEMGHHLEYSDPDLFATAKALIRQKRKDETLLTLESSPSKPEYAFNCGFSEPYIGRSYNASNYADLDGVRATEVVSMALQNLVCINQSVRSLSEGDTIIETLLGHIKKVTQ